MSKQMERSRLHLTFHKARKGRSNKMEGMVSLNTDTFSNPFCKKMAKHPEYVCSRCYAMRLSKMYGRKACEPFVRNGEILNSDMEDWQIPRMNVAFCRLHSFGELCSDKHFVNLCRVAKANPDTHFALWTKRPQIVVKNCLFIPGNLVMVYSQPRINGPAVILPPFHKVFVVHNDGTELNCEAECLACLKCYKRDSGTDIIRERLR